jgi:hypothetical protein
MSNSRFGSAQSSAGRKSKTASGGGSGPERTSGAASFLGLGNAALLEAVIRRTLGVVAGLGFVKCEADRDVGTDRATTGLGSCGMRGVQGALWVVVLHPMDRRSGVKPRFPSLLGFFGVPSPG